MDKKIFKYALFGRDDKGSYIFTVTAENPYQARSKIRKIGFQSYLDPNSFIIDNIIDLDNTKVAK